MPNLLLIVCGSAAAWMRLLLFSLRETERYQQDQGIDFPRKQICELYMNVGGIPKYLSCISRGLSAPRWSISSASPLRHPF